MAIDFPALAARLLGSADALLAAWFPAGKIRGAEYLVGNLAGEPGESLSINRHTGHWCDFSTGEKGGDLTSLYAARQHISQAEAARQLDGSPLPRSNGQSGHAHAPKPESPALPAPVDYPPPPTPPQSWGKPTGVWPYLPADLALGPLFLVVRYDPPGASKQLRPCTWRSGRWQWKAYPEPRPLYRLRELLASPALPVLIVEGEKCADAACAALGASYAVTTWSGGASAQAKTDLAPLAGRDVLIWPDADEPGRTAAAAIARRLHGQTVSLRVLAPPDGKPKGWDVADALAEGMSVEALETLLGGARELAVHAPDAAQPPDEPDDPGPGTSDDAPRRITRARPERAKGDTVHPSGAVEASPFVSWESLGLERAGNGAPHASLANMVLILERHPELTGRLWLDTFRGRLRHSFGADSAPWTDTDALRLLSWVQQQLRIPKFGLDTLHHAVQLVGANHARSSVLTWLHSLVWDQRLRLKHWTTDCLGTPHTEWEEAIGRNWLISMVARAEQPGCKADHMPVLEGSSGAGKSSALAVLGGEWYRAVPQAFGSKEFLEAIQGTWLAEIPDMVGFGRREHSQIIAAITTPSDVYRASYGRLAEDHPRVTILAATSETDEYLQEARGKRRYWPLKCAEIRLDLLAELRSQLFAEALEAYRSGASWHAVPGELAEAEQDRRRQSDAWEPLIEKFLTHASRPDQDGSHYWSPRDRPLDEVSVSQVLSDCLHIPEGRWTRADQMRIAAAFQAMRWERKRRTDGWKYVRPRPMPDVS